MNVLASVSHEVHADPAWWFLGLIALQTILFAWLASKHLYVRSDGAYKPAFTALQIFSAFLLCGAIVAQFWAHGDPNTYHATMHYSFGSILGAALTPHFIVNDIFMAFFFGIAAKELSEAVMKKKGTLRGVQGFLPSIACLGGVIGPAVVYRMICTPSMANAWAVPCATDIAFAWFGARLIWGPKHPAVTFLLALAIADDFIGMGIIAAFYPQHEFHFFGLVLIAIGMTVAFIFRNLAHRLPAFRAWWIYMIPGVVCWFGLLHAGLHAALALVFVVPFMPMEGRDDGIFAPDENEHHHDTVNNFEHAFKPIVDVGLLGFGLANAGVAWLGQGTWDQNSSAVFWGLGIGKTVGITLFTVLGFVALKFFMREKATLPVSEDGIRMSWRDVPVIGVLGAMGFTVALFVADAAGGAPSLKIGALASFAYLGLGIAAGKLLCSTREVNEVEKKVEISTAEMECEAVS